MHALQLPFIYFNTTKAKNANKQMPQTKIAKNLADFAMLNAIKEETYATIKEETETATAVFVPSSFFMLNMQAMQGVHKNINTSKLSALSKERLMFARVSALDAENPLAITKEEKASSFAIMLVKIAHTQATLLSPIGENIGEIKLHIWYNIDWFEKPSTYSNEKEKEDKNHKNTEQEKISKENRKAKSLKKFSVANNIFFVEGNASLGISIKSSVCEEGVFEIVL